MAGAREPTKKRSRLAPCPILHRTSAAVCSEPAMAALPILDSFAFTSIRKPSPYSRARVELAEENLRVGFSTDCPLEMATSSQTFFSKHCKGGMDTDLENPLLLGDVSKAPFLSYRQNESSSADHGDDEELVQSGSNLGETIPGACDALVDVARTLVVDLKDLTFRAPVSCVYNPLVYAQDLHEQYIRKHGGRRIEVLLVGMNPGPFGMAQTGVPFGDSKLVRTFHGISGKVDLPETVHPRRPVHGLESRRSEISGQRLWGWARDRFGCATTFFNRFWVYNYCPLVFMEASGKNRTPDKLHPPERTELELACNSALVKTVLILKPTFVIGIGKYAASKIRQCNFTGIEVKVGDIMHPSPANPLANKDWGKKVEAQLMELGVALPK